MFRFKKQKPVVLSQTNVVPLNATMAVIKAYYALCVAPIFNRSEPSLKDVRISIDPSSYETATKGGEVHRCVLKGHYEADGIGCKVNFPFLAEMLVCLYGDGNAPHIAWQGYHRLTLESTTLTAIFSDTEHFEFATETDERKVVGPWHSSDDLKTLNQLGLPVRLENHLYSLRIRTLGQLKQWKRSQIVADMDDVSLRAALDIAVEKLGITLKPE